MTDSRRERWTDGLDGQLQRKYGLQQTDGIETDLGTAIATLRSCCEPPP